MVAVVNGYVCFSSCDAAKAKQGKDPNAPPGAESDPSMTHDASKPKSVSGGRPATIVGGALQDLTNAVNPSGQDGSTGSDYQSPARIDRFA